MTSTPHIRSGLEPGDLGAIVAHHGSLYHREYGVDATFEGHVAASVARAAARGFPTEREAIRIVELDGRHAGSLALTDEGDGTAALRWFVFDPAVRGRGLGRRLLDELLATAERAGHTQVWLETFSELEAAAHLYRSRGFTMVSQESGPRWGRESIIYQRYELELPTAASSRHGRISQAPRAAPDVDGTTQRSLTPIRAS